MHAFIIRAALAGRLTQVKAVALLAGLACIAGAARAQDVSRGALLYDTHCIACHREGLHDRANSKVASYADLRQQVERWTAQTGRRFTEADREDLIEYLDASHYRLDRRAAKAPLPRQ